jgi:hypothetical protein
MRRLLWEWNSVLLDGKFTQLRDVTREKLEWKALIYALIILINRSGLSNTIEQCYQSTPTAHEKLDCC